MAAGTFSAKDVSHISKFKGDQFNFYKFQLKLVLMNHGLLNVVEGVYQKPTVVAPVANPSNAAAVTANTDEINEWMKMDIAAQNFIVSTIEEKVMRTIMTCTTSHLMWTRLLNQYELASMENKHLLMGKFMSYQYDSNHDIMIHIAAIESLAAQLRDVNSAVSDDQIIAKITSTLPLNGNRNYKAFMSAWNSTDDKIKTIPLLASRLQVEENMLKLADVTMEPSDSGAFFVNKRKGKVAFSESKREFNRNEHRPKVICAYCTKLNRRANHLEEDCWLKQSYLQGKRDAGSGDALLTQSSRTERPTEEDSYAFKSTGIQFDSDCWYADSGASEHMSDIRDLFNNFQQIPPGKRLIKGVGKNNEALHATGVGDIAIRCKVDDVWHNGTLRKVLFVPNLGVNLFSIGAATERDIVASFDNNGVTLSNNGKIVGTGSKIQKRLYKMHFLNYQPPAEYAALAARAKPNSIQIWHERLGHVNFATLKKMNSANFVEGLFIDNSTDTPPFCEGCVFGKHHRLPFPTCGRTRATKRGGLIHSDLCGPMSVPSLNGSLYFLTFRDDFTGYGFIRFLKKKSEVSSNIQQLIALFETETNERIVTLRSDNGGEYMSKELMQWIANKGIVHQTSTAKTPEQNGVAERYNRTILESAKSMLHSSTLGTQFWAEASAAAVYLHNRVSCKAMQTMTPYQGWHGRKPNVSHLHIFGCDAYYHIPKDERSKLEPKGQKCKFVGYSETQKAFRLYDPSSGKVKISRDVIFNENLSEAPIMSPPCCDVADVDILTEHRVGGDASASNDRATVSNSIICSNDTQATIEVEDIIEPFHGFDAPEAAMDPSLKTSRIRRKPDRLIEDPNFLCATTEDSSSIIEPQSYEEAITSPDAKKWISAMEEEMSSLEENQTWRLEKLPSGRKTIKCKWVYKVKMDSFGHPVRYKARLVAKGFSQKEGVDYDETFSPVVRHESVRAILSTAAANDLEILQLDVRTAFLHGELTEEIFMDQPTGFTSTAYPTNVCRLQKSLYGLKQASRLWNIKFDGLLVNLGFTRSPIDSCVYHHNGGDGIIILAIWVDDGLLCGRDKKRLLEIINQLSDHLEISTQEADLFIGIKIDRDRPNRTIYLSQEQYIIRILHRFKMAECNPKGLPADPFSRLTLAGVDGGPCSPSCDQSIYREAVGSLMFLMVCTRPDISYAVGQVAQFCHDPKQVHWSAVTRILSYLKGTSKFGVVYKVGEKPQVLTAYADSDYAGDTDSRKSTSGFLLIFNEGPIAWGSRRQSCVSLSTTEAEYVAMCEATKEIVWARQLLDSIGCVQTQPTALFGDNQGAVKLTLNPEFHRRTKHIDIRYHYIREQQVSGNIAVVHIGTKDQLADLLTKALPGPAFPELRTRIGVVPV